MEDLRFRLCRFDLVPCRRWFLPATRLRFRDEVGLCCHLPLDSILRKVIVIVPRTRAYTRLCTQVLRYYCVVRGI